MPRYYVIASKSQRADKAHDKHYKRLAEKQKKADKKGGKGCGNDLRNACYAKH